MAQQQQQPPTDTLIRPAAPRGDATERSPIILYVYEPGRREPYRVEVPNVPRRIDANETAEQARMRKAQAMVDRINAVLPAPVGQQRATLDANGVIRIRNSRGIKIQAVDRMPDANDPRGFRLVEGDPTKQGGTTANQGNQGQIVPGQSGTTTPGSGGSMGGKGMTPEPQNNVIPDASGQDSFGDPSVVSMGILEQYVAHVFPQPGDSPDEVLTQLMTLLEANNIPMDYDPATEILSFHRFIPPEQTFVWGNTDSQMALGAEFLTIPEPAAILLALLGFVALFCCRRAANRQPCRPA